MTEQIKTILTPLRELSVSDAMKIAELYLPNRPQDHPIVHRTDNDKRNGIAISILTRYERIQNMKLEPGMFVPGVSKPSYYDDFKKEHSVYGLYLTEPEEEEIEAYESALSKVLFEGFEKRDEHSVSSGETTIWVNKKRGAWIISGKLDCPADTIGDLLHHITKYNETAANPIQIVPTINYVNLLIV